MPEPEPTAYTFTTSVSCFQWVPLLSQRGFDFSTTSVGQAWRGGVMAIGKARSRAVDSPMICSRTRCELTVVVILAVLTIFLFPSVQGPYSVVRGPATAFRAARSAAIAHASIVQGAMRSIRNSPGSPRLVFARLTSRKRDRTQKQCRNVVRLSAVNSQRVAVLAGPQLYASSVNFHAHSGSHSQHQ